MRRFLLLLSALMLAACASNTRVGEAPGLHMVSGTEMPTPTLADYQPSEAPYLIGPLDTLTLDIAGLDEFKNREVQVDASGRLSVPYAGVIDAAGRTPTELAKGIEAALRTSYFREPHVTVNMKKTESQTVTVAGDVKEPGIFPVVGDMTLLRAIAAAKGTTDTSKLDNVVLFRTVNGQRMAALYNVKMIRRGNYEDPRIYANDLVVVDDSRARRIFKDFLQLAPLLSSPLIIALQNN
jgi:polysaccharide export outer membrane protein